MIPKHSYKFARLFCLYSLLILKHYPVQESLLFSYSSSQETAHRKQLQFRKAQTSVKLFSLTLKKKKSKQKTTKPTQPTNKKTQ